MALCHWTEFQVQGSLTSSSSFLDERMSHPKIFAYLAMTIWHGLYPEACYFIQVFKNYTHARDISCYDSPAEPPPSPRLKSSPCSSSPHLEQACAACLRVVIYELIHHSGLQREQKQENGGWGCGCEYILSSRGVCLMRRQCRGTSKRYTTSRTAVFMKLGMSQEIRGSQVWKPEIPERMDCVAWNNITNKGGGDTWMSTFIMQWVCDGLL